MKIIILTLAVAAAVWAQPAQVISGDIVFSGGTVDMTASRYVKPFRIVAASPSGACALAWDTVYSSEDSKIYTCQSGSWVVIAADGTTVGVGTSPPGTCSVGQLFFDSNATAGQNLYGCTATNTWTQLGGSGGTYTAGTGLSLVADEFSVNTAVIETRANAQAGATRYCSSATGDDTYTCTMTPTLTAYTTGMVITLNAGTANTGPATLNIDTLGAVNIYKRDGSALSNGDIPANKPVLLAYDGTQFVLVGDGGGGTSDPNMVTASGTLTSDAPMIGAGSKAASVGSRSGTTTEFATITGSKTTGRPLEFDASGNVIASASAYKAKVFQEKFLASDSSESGEHLVPALTDGATASFSGLAYGNAFGKLTFADAATKYAVARMIIPSNWSSGDGISLTFEWSQDVGSGNVVWQAETACIASTETLFGFSFNAAQTVTGAANASASRRHVSTISSLTLTGCAANEWLVVRVARLGGDGSDTMAGTADLLGVRLGYYATLE